MSPDYDSPVTVSSYGWYNGYYYPGTGYYVYDRYRRPIAGRRSAALLAVAPARCTAFDQPRTGQILQNWRDFRTDRRPDNRAFRVERNVTTDGRSARGRR